MTLPPSAPAPSVEPDMADVKDTALDTEVCRVMAEINACSPGYTLAQVPTLFAFGPIKRALWRARAGQDRAAVVTWLEQKSKQVDEERWAAIHDAEHVRAALKLAVYAWLKAEIRALHADPPKEPR